MGSGETSKVEKLINFFMERVSAAADEEDWAEADGWVGRWIIIGEHDRITKIYEVRDGRFWPTGPKQEYTGTVTMSEDTFLDLMDAAIYGKGEDVFALKYAKRAIEYEGDQWVVDSERFRKVLRRLGAIKIRG